jgi:ribosomal protein L1
MKKARPVIDRYTRYAAERAVGLVKRAARAKHVETVELVVMLNVYRRHTRPAGRIELPSGHGALTWTADAEGIVHAPIGKVSYDEPMLLANAKALIESVRATRPDDITGPYIRKITMKSDQGPSIQVDHAPFN